MADRRWRNAYANVCFFTLIAAAAVGIALLSESTSSAAVNYGTIGSFYPQTFDTLPNTPTNTSLGNSPAGWRDDTASPGAGNFSIVGWYLYHPTSPTEGGFNGNQRMRIGTGTATTGAFWSFGPAASTDRALGSLASANTAGNEALQYMALRLTNSTGVELNDFTLTFAGEQWRDGVANNPLTFEYSTAVNETSWFNNLGYTAVSQLNFAPPVSTNNDAAVDGNGVGRTAGITHTVTGAGWQPGTDLWLRWGQIQQTSTSDDGLAIDDLTFSAVEGTPGGGNNIVSVQTGSANTGSTWSNSQPQMADKFYTIQNTHTVDLPSNFLGDKLTVAAGGTLNVSAIDGSGLNGLDIPWLSVEAGGDITENVSGNFFIGNIDAEPLNLFEVHSNLTFNIDSGSFFGLFSDLVGEGDIDFNQSGGTLVLKAAADHTGTIRFNGTGGQVQLLFEEGVFDLEMNAPGQELIFNSSAGSLDASTETVTFNAPGTARHISTVAGTRNAGAQQFHINADVTVDLTQFFGAQERRWLTTGRLEGTEDLTVNGTATPPVGVDVNEFEIGSQGTTENEPNNLVNSLFSGTVTLNDYVNMEVRQNLRNATIVIGNHAILDMGHMTRTPANSVHIGEIEVLNGGTLEVGMEQSDPAVNNVDGHFAYHLTLDDAGGKSGGLVMQDGSQLNMQINGTALAHFDRITADGDVALNGTLKIFVNPASCIGNPGGQNGCSLLEADENPTFDPALNVGATWDIITTTASSPPGDYDGNGTVNDADRLEWIEVYGETAGADGNGDGVVDAADYVVWQKFFGSTGSGATISGSFDSVIDDLAGFHFDVTNLGNILRLTLATGEAGGGGAVPEPSTFAVVGIMLCVAGAVRRSRRSEA